MTKEGIERYNLMVKLFEAVDQRPKDYCVKLNKGYSSIYLENKESSRSLIDNTEPEF